MDRLRLAAAALSIALAAPAGISLLPAPARGASSAEEAATREPSKERKEKKKKKGLSLWNRLRTEGSEAASGEATDATSPKAARPETAAPAKRETRSASAPRIDARPAAPSPAAQAAATPAMPAPEQASQAPGRPRLLSPRSLARVHGQILVTPLAQDPVAKSYLDAIENGEATPERLNEFAIYLGRKGYTGAAVDVQEEAVRQSPKNPLFWINLGTLHREAGSIGLAKRDFGKAIALDPNNAFAYYNLGAVLDAEAQYDQAVELYKKALRLDPSLSDPRRNPQVVNNQRLLAVSLLLYRERAGALGLPLLSSAPTADSAAGKANKPKSEGSPERP